MSVPEDVETALAPPLARMTSARVRDPEGDALRRDYLGLYAMIHRLVQDPQLAGDILQDAVVTTLQKLRSGQIDRAECAGGYIYRVALNHLRNYRRKDRSRISDPESLATLENPSIDAAVEAADGASWSHLVALVLNELPTLRDREILVRFYLDEEEKDSICQSLGLTEAHFHRVIFRARTRFRELVERKGYSKRDLLAIVFASLCFAMLAPQRLHAQPAQPWHVGPAAPLVAACSGRSIGDDT